MDQAKRDQDYRTQQNETNFESLTAEYKKATEVKIELVDQDNEGMDLLGRVNNLFELLEFTQKAQKGQEYQMRGLEKKLEEFADW